MEEIEFQQWITNLNNQEIKYSVTYDEDTMQIIQVGPSHALKNNKNCLEIDSEIAERILSGEISIHSCYLDATNGEVAVTETKSLIKIDDVLHRIPDLKWSEIEKPDVYLQVDKNLQIVTIQLGAQWGGTYKSKNLNYSKPRKILWSGDTSMEFLITGYNDPNVIYDFFNFSIQDLIDNKLKFNIKIPHSDISVYTKRIFKNYIIEYV